ncbi:MAG: malate synthase A [Anaerolineae bacterium]
MIKTENIEIIGPVKSEWSDILSPEALAFVAALEMEFGARRRELLQARKERQAAIDAGEMPDFLASTKSVRDASWTVAPAPHDLLNRRAEITGPTDRKMVINALNSGAQVFMADFEDANSPAWENMVDGQINLYDAVRRTISLSEGGKEYRLKDQTATLAVRPRGWHLPEKHVLVNGRPITGAFFDFGLYFFHNAKAAIERGTGPYFYLPKMQSHLEARLWNDVFNYAQDALGIPRGTIRGTVLIEHILASFEMEEILYELKDHSSGLNLGRWDYIYSFIKVFNKRGDLVFPDRAQVTMATHFLRSAAELLTYTCHKRGAHAMGGMSAYIPRGGDPSVNEKAFAQVQTDKTREAGQGFDGAWVAHPGLVTVVQEIFDKAFTGFHQLDKIIPSNVTAQDLLTVPPGDITEAGFRNNVNVALQYLEAWLGGRGAVAIFNLMEDVATAEIARSQLWQWIHHNSKMSDGAPITPDMYTQVRTEEVAGLVANRSTHRFAQAVELLDSLALNEEFVEFLTLPGYQRLE